MSLIVTAFVREGIVMASDSRLTLNATGQQDTKQVTQLAVSQTDTVHKTFLTECGVGISTCGAADIHGIPITGFIESFIRGLANSGDSPTDVREVAEGLLCYFKQMDNPPDARFQVAGYDRTDAGTCQLVYGVAVSQNSVWQINPPETYSIAWDGEADVLLRLTQDMFMRGADGQEQRVAQYPVHANYFTLQDAIDFALYAIQVTIDTMRFQARPKTVGGPVDVLVITPDRGRWVKRKELVA